MYLLYLPICFAIVLVLETCRYDDPKVILRRTLRQTGALTGALIVGAGVLYLLHRWL